MVFGPPGATSLAALVAGIVNCRLELVFKILLSRITPFGRIQDKFVTSSPPTHPTPVVAFILASVN